jgi:hypothetical protein
MYAFAAKPTAGVQLMNRLTARAVKNACDPTLTSIAFETLRLDDVESEVQILRREGARGYVFSPHAPIPVVRGMHL